MDFKSIHEQDFLAFCFHKDILELLSEVDKLMTVMHHIRINLNTQISQVLKWNLLPSESNDDSGGTAVEYALVRLLHMGV